MNFNDDSKSKTKQIGGKKKRKRGEFAVEFANFKINAPLSLSSRDRFQLLFPHELPYSFSLLLNRRNLIALLRLAYCLGTDFHENSRRIFFGLRNRAFRPCPKECEPRTDAQILLGLIALMVLIFFNVMFTSRNNEESKSFEVIFLFFFWRRSSMTYISVHFLHLGFGIMLVSEP